MRQTLPEILQRYLSAYEKKDVEAMLATMTPDVVFEDLPNGHEPTSTNGKEALWTLARQSAQCFSSRRQTVTDAVVAGDRVALQVVFEAVVACDLPNGWRAGQAVRLTGASFFTLRDGLIARVVDLS